MNIESPRKLKTIKNTFLMKNSINSLLEKRAEKYRNLLIKNGLATSNAEISLSRGFTKNTVNMELTGAEFTEEIEDFIKNTMIFVKKLIFVDNKGEKIYITF